MTRKRSRSSTSPSDSGVDASKRVYAHSVSADSREGSVDQYPLRVHIISAKLKPSALEDLVNLVEKPVAQHARQASVRTLKLTTDLDHADVIVTAVHTKPRLERHVRWELAKTKAIVTPDWLRDSISSGTIQPCRKYAALSDLSDELRCSSPGGKAGTPPGLSIPVDPEVKDIDFAALDHLSYLSCQRASPLICPNQALAEQLEIIRRARLYEGEERSMLSYARAIASIKAYPHCFTEQTVPKDIAKVPYLGTKLNAMVKEFTKTGKISEAQGFLCSPRFLTLSAFNTIHGIGPHTARNLYSLGLRTIEDLEKYYEVTAETTLEGIQSHLQAGHSKEIGVEKSIQLSLILRHHFSQKIPRQEVEEINQVIMREVELIDAGCKGMLVGGYRRGKLLSNDVDIIISHTDLEHGVDKMRGLCKKLVQRLHERGLVKHVLNMSGYHPHNVFGTHHWDSLEKAFMVFVLPNDSARQRTYRRVDLIFASPGLFWTAVVGWTGSTMFERDLRVWAKTKGLKFDSSGITRRHDSSLLLPQSEREVFELLGLAYVHPRLRNADA